MDWSPIVLTLKLAFITTILLLLIGVPFAYWLARTHFRLKPVIEALVSMPLVLPPSVLGFYLLLVFSPQQGIGAWLNNTIGLSLAFSFEGLVLASVLFSFPFLVHPVQAGIEQMSNSLIEASYVLGKSKWVTFYRVVLPNIRSALLSGTVLSFAHTMGEFGVVLMIGGNIPNQTRVASIAIFEEVETLNYAAAHAYSAILVLISFSVLLIVYLSQKRMTHAFR